MNLFEVLAPLAQLEALQAIMEAGADAVYAGLYGFSSRPVSADLSLDQLSRAREKTLNKGVKLMVALNAFVNHTETEKLLWQVEALDKIGVDAIILSDWGALWSARDIVQHTQLHASTLLGVYNAETVNLLQSMGIARVVLSTTLYIDEMYKIMKSVPTMEYEIIASGGVCGNDNRQCELPHSGDTNNYQVACRKTYQLRRERSTQIAKPISMPEAQLERTIGTYMALGVYSYKIEGRTLPEAIICRRIARLRHAIDYFLTDQANFQYYNPYLSRTGRCTE